MNTQIETVKEVDINKYMGKWYEIASIPNRFQKGCSCSVAEYTLKDGYVEVINSCIKNERNSRVKGRAFTVKNSGNAKLKVQFFWPFKGDYWIIELDKDYKYSVVSGSDMKYLWILSRTPIMEESTYNMLLEKIKAKGFDLNKVVKTQQKCNK